MDNSGFPVTDGNYSMQFAIYDGEDSGSALWAEYHNAIPVVASIYNVVFGTGTNLSGSFESELFSGDDRWLEIIVQGEILSPRYKLSSVAYALQANETDPTVDPSVKDGVTWSEISNIPSDIDDGDQGISEELDPTVELSVKDGIAWGEIANIPSDISDGDQGITEELDPTVDPSVKDGVHWDEIDSIPIGFSDGIDNVGTGVGDNHSLDAADGVPVDALYMDDEGNVGINMWTPISPLHISKQSFVSGVTRSSIVAVDNSPLAAGNGGGISFGAAVGSRGELAPILANIKGIKENSISGNLSGSLVFSTMVQGAVAAIYERMRITSIGNVGIGTTSPANKLHVNGTAQFDGNVGIGISNPTHDLHVNGLAQFELGSGSIAISTPGGNPGLISFAPNGNRRDITVTNEGISITTSASVSAPSPTNGIFINESGRLKTTSLEIIGGSDLAEQFDINSYSDRLKVVPGMVVSIDPENPGKLRVSQSSYDRKVAGIISGAGGINPGMLMGQVDSPADGASPVALSGRVYAWADASGSPIEPGDLLTTSHIPGHAMRVKDYKKAQGAIIGKAMTGLEAGRGHILVLVSLQ